MTFGDGERGVGGGGGAGVTMFRKGNSVENIDK